MRRPPASDISHIRAAREDVEVLVANAVGRLLRRREVNGIAVKRYYGKNRIAQMCRQNDWRLRNRDRVNARRRALRALRHG